MPGQKGFGMGEQLVSRCGQAHARAAAVQESLACQRFQALHLHAQRRLRPSDLQRGDADRARARDDGEVPEQSEVERRMAINLIDIGMKEYQFAQCNKRASLWKLPVRGDPCR
jgi:hypothetical protein